MIETGTPSNQATPYFIMSLQTTISVIGLCNSHSKELKPRRNHPCFDLRAEVVMRGLNHHIGSPSMALVTESVDVVTTFKQLMSRMRKATRHSLCSVLHGGHELYKARTDTKLYQQCLLCGYETKGWTIDRRDRRLHLVSNTQPSASSAAVRR